jgi:hypothetical protein
MEKLEGKYNGAALQAFVLGLERSKPLIEKVLKDHGLDRVDPERWYDLNLARSIYYSVGKLVGARSVKAVGLKIIDAALFPPEVNDVRSVLASLDAAYHLNTQGTGLGYIACTFEDARSASIVFAIPFPCALAIGVIQGCCKKFGARPLVEHGTGGCIDDGAPSCTYRVSW